MVVSLLSGGCFLFQPSNAATSTPGTAAPGTAGAPTSPESSSGPMAADPAASPEPTPTPAGPVSVTLRNACPQTVRLFFGDKPKFGSGTTSTLGSNTVTSHSFQPGDMLWIVDESDNGLSSTSIAASTREIEVTSGCTGFQVR
ncbi:MAG: hypothetical protein K1X88_16315 [Nannocystaceae bacterium]|nr:hypothetical protein [Nannocystaceae bacterium]